MEKCSICGKSILFKTCFGKVTLCKQCDALINASSWNKRDFISIEDLLEKKKNALELAKQNGLSCEIISSITDFFDEYINDGFITSIDGGAGQKLTIFEDYCIVDTKNESKKAELQNMFYQFDDEYDQENENDDELITTEQKTNLINGLMSGRIVQTGIGYVTSVAINKEEKEKNNRKKLKEKQKKIGKLIKVGEQCIRFCDIKEVDTYSAVNAINGYLRFIPINVSSDELYECQYFFFNNSKLFKSKKNKQRIEDVKKIINDKISLIVKERLENEQKEEQMKKNNNENYIDLFEEVRKYKELFDEGIITEEEFQKKKKDLLNL